MANNSDTNYQNQYFHFIDVLRFLAIFTSFLHHSHIIFFTYGHTFFFVLSGFILTYQAKNEYVKKGTFNIFKFTMRRVLRIFPLYFLVVLASYYLVPLVTQQEVTLAPIGYYLSFTSNYYSVGHVFMLMILWSVAVQEQFYVFVSVCYKFLYKYIIWIGLLMIVCSIFYKLYAEVNQINVYAHTLNHFSSFGIGIIFSRLYEKNKNKQRNNRVYLVVLILGLLFLLFASLINSFTWSIIGDSIVSLVFGYLILFLCLLKNIDNNNIVLKFFENLGQFSYGLYCYQGVVITFGNIVLMKYLNISNEYMLVGINFTILIFTAFVSYHLFEKRILNLKRYFR